MVYKDVNYHVCHEVHNEADFIESFTVSSMFVVCPNFYWLVFKCSNASLIFASYPAL